ncbi:MAG: transcriptional regulator, partial [Verrucomicrobia bacterium]|nr:transcriptional regulator [Verrucomicrobiota bacterium]
MNPDLPIEFSGIDTAVHGPIRLGVLTALQADGALDFTTLRQRLGVADGALGTHLQKLEAIGYVSCTKQFVGRRPKSTYGIAEAGRVALFNYLDQMQRLIDSLNRNPNNQPNLEEPRNHGD